MSRVTMAEGSVYLFALCISSLQLSKAMWQLRMKAVARTDTHESSSEKEKNAAVSKRANERTPTKSNKKIGKSKKKVHPISSESKSGSRLPVDKNVPEGLPDKEKLKTWDSRSPTASQASKSRGRRAAPKGLPPKKNVKSWSR